MTDDSEESDIRLRVGGSRPCARESGSRTFLDLGF